MLFRTFARDFKNKIASVFCEPQKEYFLTILKMKVSQTCHRQVNVGGKAVIASIWLTDELNCLFTWQVH